MDDLHRGQNKQQPTYPEDTGQHRSSAQFGKMLPPHWQSKEKEIKMMASLVAGYRLHWHRGAWLSWKVGSLSPATPQCYHVGYQLPHGKQ